MIMGIAIASSLPIGVNMIMDSFIGGVYNQVSNSIPDDIRLRMPPMESVDLASIFAAIEPPPVDFDWVSRFYSSSAVNRNWSQGDSPRQSDILGINSTIDWFDDSLTIRSGSIIDVGGSGVAISLQLSHLLGVSLGEDLEVIVNRVSAIVTVVCVFHRSGFTDDRLIIMDLASVGTLFDTDLITEVGIRFRDCPPSVEIYTSRLDIISQLLDDNFDESVFIYEKLPIIEGEVNTINANREFSLLLTSLSLITGCIGVVMFFLVTYHEQMREYAVLKTVGVKNSRLLSIPITNVLILITIGLVLAIPVAIVGSYSLISAGANLMVLESPFGYTPVKVPLRILPSAFVLPMISQYLISTLAVIYPAYRITRMPCVIGLQPMAQRSELSIRRRYSILSGSLLITFASLLAYYASKMVQSSSADITGFMNLILLTNIAGILLLSYGLFEFLSKVIDISSHWLKGLEVITKKHILLKRAQSWSISTAYAIGIVVILTFSIMSTSFRCQAIESIYTTNGSDLLLVGYHPPSIHDKLLENPCVDHTTSIFCFDTLQIRIDGLSSIKIGDETRHIDLFVLDPTSYQQTCRWEYMTEIDMIWSQILSSWNANPNAAVVDNRIMSSMDLTAGSSIQLSIGDELVSVFNESIDILSGIDLLPGLGVYGNPYVVLPQALFLDLESELIGARLLVRISSNFDYEQSIQCIQEELLHLSLDIHPTNYLVENRLSQWNLITTIFDSISLFSLVVATVGLTVALVTSVLNRRSEFGILRSMGIEKIRSLILLEGFALGVIGFLIGFVMTVSSIVIMSMVNPSLQLMRYFPSILLTIALLFTIVAVLVLLGSSISVRSIESETPAGNLRVI